MATVAATKPTLPTTLTASTWATVWQAAWARVLSAHGMAYADDADRTKGPRLTNGEALAFVAAWHEASGARFPLWYQFAAVAYGWDADRDRLDTSAKQAARAYLPDDVNVALWVETYRIALALDAEHDDGTNANSPRLALDTPFGDVVFAAKVRAQLIEDGADAAFKIPTGLCIDKKTGKRRPMTRPRCGPDGKYRDPITGIDRPCSKPGDCDPEMIDDPITKIGKDVFTLVLIVGAVWWLAKRKPRRQRRT